MPTYVYECSSCSKTFEAEQRISEAPLNVCHCGSEGTVKRIIQPIAVMFKGAGFHINDYKGSGGSSSTESSLSTASASESCATDSGSCACKPE